MRNVVFARKCEWRRAVGKNGAGINKGGDHRIANVSKRNIILFRRLQGVRLGARLFRRSREWNREVRATEGDRDGGWRWGRCRGRQSLAFSLCVDFMDPRVQVRTSGGLSHHHTYKYYSTRRALLVHTHLTAGRAQTSGFAWIRIHYVSIQNKRPPVIQRPPFKTRSLFLLSRL